MRAGVGEDLRRQRDGPVDVGRDDPLELLDGDQQRRRALHRPHRDMGRRVLRQRVLGRPDLVAQGQPARDLVGRLQSLGDVASAAAAQLGVDPVEQPAVDVLATQLVLARRRRDHEPALLARLGAQDGDVEGAAAEVEHRDAAARGQPGGAQVPARGGDGLGQQAQPRRHDELRGLRELLPPSRAPRLGMGQHDLLGRRPTRGGDRPRRDLPQHRRDQVDDGDLPVVEPDRVVADAALGCGLEPGRRRHRPRRRRLPDDDLAALDEHARRHLVGVTGEPYGADLAARHAHRGDGVGRPEVDGQDPAGAHEKCSTRVAVEVGAGMLIPLPPRTR